MAADNSDDRDEIGSDTDVRGNDCESDDSFDVGYGDCATYGPGLMNSGYCEVDDGCDACCECADECESDSDIDQNNQPETMTELDAVIETYCDVSSWSDVKSDCGWDASECKALIDNMDNNGPS